MAEVSRTVPGAVSTASLFNECVDCFDHIQISRNFGDDFSRYQLRLDVAKCRLSRWGTAISLNNDPRFLRDTSKDPRMALARELLGGIVARFKVAQKSSVLHETISKQHNVGTFSRTDLGTVPLRLHDRFQALTLQRQSRAGLTKKAYWAIYDKNMMGRMIDDVFGIMNDLEVLIPASVEATGRLVEMEVGKVSDLKELQMIYDVARDFDPILEDKTKGKMQEILGKNTAGRIHGTARINIGHTYVKESFLLSKGFRDTSANHVDEINGGESTRVNIGNTYGGKGVWD